MTITRVPTAKTSGITSKGEVASRVNVLSVAGARRAFPRDDFFEALDSAGDNKVDTVESDKSSVGGSAGVTGKLIVLSPRPEASGRTLAVRVRAWIGDVLSDIRGVSFLEPSDPEVCVAFESFNDSRLTSSEESRSPWLFL